MTLVITSYAAQPHISLRRNKSVCNYQFFKNKSVINTPTEKKTCLGKSFFN